MAFSLEKGLSLRRLAARNAYNDTPAHIKEQYPVSGLQSEPARKKRTKQLSSLCTGERLREMMKKRSYYAFEKLFPLVAAFMGRSLDFEERYYLTIVNVLFNKKVNKVLFDHIGETWAEGKLMGLLSEFRKFKRVVETKFAPDRSSGLFTRKFYFLDRLRDSSRRFGSLLYVNGGPFEHFSVLT